MSTAVTLVKSPSSDITTVSPDEKAISRGSSVDSREALRCRSSSFLRCASAGALLASISMAPCSAVEMRIDPIKVDDVQFRFDSTATGEMVEASPANAQIEGKLRIQTGSYEIFLDSIRKPQGDCDYFSYVFYARPKSRSGGRQWLRFSLTGYPVGLVRDQLASADIQLDDNDQSIHDKVHDVLLPVFSCKKTGVLSSAAFNPSKPATVVVGPMGGSPIPIPFSNAFGNDGRSLSLFVHCEQPEGYQKYYWAGTTFIKYRPDSVFQMKGQTDDSINLYAEPKPSRAILASLFSFTRREPDDDIHFKCAYNTLYGIERPLTVHVPVRFSPWVPWLYIAVTLGCLLGSSIHALLSTKHNRHRDLFRDVTVALAISCLVESLALLQARSGPLSLLGVDLDPLSLLSATVIGCLIGLLGFRGCKLIVASILTAFKPMEPKADAP